MKGLIGVIILIMVVVLLIEGMTLSTLIGSSMNVQIAAREADVLNTLNQLTLVQRGIPYALNYSFFQGEYVIGKNGGYYSFTDLAQTTGWAHPYWRVYNDKFFPSDYLGKIEELTKEYFLQYFSQVVRCKNGNPEFDVKTETSGSDIYIFLVQEEPIKIMGSFYNISNITFPLRQTEDRDIVDMFNLGKNIFVDRDNVSLAIEAAEEEMKHVVTKRNGRAVTLNYREINAGEVCEKMLQTVSGCGPDYFCANVWSEYPCIRDPECVLRHLRPDADEMFNKTMKMEIEKAQGNIGKKFHLFIRVIREKSKHTGKIKKYQEGFCDIVEDEYEIDTSESCETGYEKKCSKITGECECVKHKKVPRYHVEYLYNYSGAAEVEVHISSNTMVPVYDFGFTAYRNLTLGFWIISSYTPDSNDRYTYKPLKPVPAKLNKVWNLQGATTTAKKKSSGMHICELKYGDWL